MDKKEVAHLLAEAKAQSYADGYLNGYMDCVTERAAILGKEPELKLLAMPVTGQVQ